MEISLKGNSHQRRIQLRRLKREYNTVENTYGVHSNYYTYTVNGFKGQFKYNPVRI